MIKYRLRCQHGHEFETWFQSSDVYEMLAKRQQLACETCGSDRVEKAMMAPSIAKRTVELPGGAPPARAGFVAPVAEPPSGDRGTSETDARELRAAFKAMRQELITNSDDVGPRFADEARRIHDEEAPARSIHGQATRAEALALIEDGIAFLPLPPAADDAN